MSRRSLLKLLGGASAAMALGGSLPGCKRKPHREIVSRAEMPERQASGQVYYYSSTWTEGPYPYGMMVKTVDGRPVKIEGNPDHPINRGVTTAAMQAAILSLYDPDRSKGPLRRGKPVSWGDADQEIIAALKKAKSVVVITRGNITGCAKQTLLEESTKALPNCRHFVHETVHDGPLRRVWKELYGIEQIVPRFDTASTILSFDCDFLGSEGVALESVARFVAGRDLDNQDPAEGRISRFYAIESAVTATSARADHRIRMKPSAMADFALALSHLAEKNKREVLAVADRFGVDEKTMMSLVMDMFSSSAVIVAGGHLPASVHAAVALLNTGVVHADYPGGSFAKTVVDATDPRQIEAALSKGVDVLIMLGVNPVYDWPGDADFKGLIAKAGLSIGHGLHLDETLSACTLALPSHHNLESWGDARAWWYLHSLCQPMIAPLFDTRQEEESLLTWTRPFAGRDDYAANAADWHEYLRDIWSSIFPTSSTYNFTQESLAGERPQSVVTATSQPVAPATARPATSQPASTQPAGSPPSEGDQAWEQALRVGGVFNLDEGTELYAVNPSEVILARAEKLAREGSPATQPEGQRPPDAFELVILPHHSIYDGRFANNGWLQELPDPVSRTVWGNFASISPASARKLGVVEGDMVRVTVKDRSVELPALIQRGMADGVVVTTLGHGRTAGGATAVEAGGANVAPLLGRENPDHPRVAFNAKVVKAPDADVAPLLGREGEGSASRERELAGGSRPPASAGGSDSAHPGGAEYGRVTYDVKGGLAGVDARLGFLRPVRTQTEFSQHGRGLVLAGTVEEYRRDPKDFVQHLRHNIHQHLPEPIDTFPPYDYSKGHHWMMAIDLSRCVGCGACVTACQAENNIPIVGRDQCARGRLMHWLRIDRYEGGDEAALENDPAVAFQPMLCQHCQAAPCETVCPVNATAHSPEGLNEMAYNRCVGTRYCQNNCPYKVRRFNFLRYHQFRLREPVQELAFNPQVTVRSVGVMEKCTFCVQRINEAKFKAYNASGTGILPVESHGQDGLATIPDGQLQTACQQACPAGAIVFGDANDPASRVAKLCSSPRGYRVLEELNTKSNVVYLARVDNPSVE